MAHRSGAHANSLHDWLAASAYVKGEDQTAKVISRKKHRSKRKTTISELQGAQREAEQKTREYWKLSNRNYRRWMNDRLLRELAPPLDAQEIGSLFAPPPWGEKSAVTPFEMVTGLGDNPARDMAAWEPFRNNVDMDVQAQILQPRERPRKIKGGSVSLKRTLAMEAWHRVDHLARNVLRRSSSWHLVQDFEEKVLTYLTEMDGGCNALVLEVKDPYHRLLLHGVSQFHGLSSQSISTWEHRDKEDGPSLVTKMHIRKKSQKEEGSSGHKQDSLLNLMQFLKEAKRQVPFSGSAA